MALAKNMNSDSQSLAIHSLLKALPSIKDNWEAHQREWQGEESGCYNDISIIAWHLKRLYPVKPTKNYPVDTSEFTTFFSSVENLYTSGDRGVSELLTVGLLESLQNITASERGRWTRFEPWLGDRTMSAWCNIIDFWNSKS